MKKKSRIKLYQILLIGHNFKFNKTVIGFKSYSRVCHCSSQVYFQFFSKFPIFPSFQLFSKFPIFIQFFSKFPNFPKIFKFFPNFSRISNFFQTFQIFFHISNFFFKLPISQNFKIFSKL